MVPLHYLAQQSSAESDAWFFFLSHTKFRQNRRPLKKVTTITQFSSLDHIVLVFRAENMKNIW